MSAGSPHAHHADAVRLTDAHTDRISRLFAEGQPAGRIALIARCTRARVAQVADAHGWQLDAAGVLPRQQRPAVVPGQPIPTVGSGLMPHAPRTVAPLPPLPPLPRIPAQRSRPTPTCSRPGCDNQVKVKSLGLCAKHYMQTRRAAAAS